LDLFLGRHGETALVFLIPGLDRHVTLTHFDFCNVGGCLQNNGLFLGRYKVYLDTIFVPVEAFNLYLSTAQTAVLMATMFHPEKTDE